MEIFLLIIGYFVLSFAYKSYKRGQAIKTLQQLAKEYEEEKRNNPFQIRAVKATLETDEFDYEVLEVQMKGLIECHEDECDVVNIIRIDDITDERMPLLCSHESFQMEDSRVFMFKSDEQSLPYKETIITNWIPIGSAPLMFIEPPRSGMRKLEFKVYIVESSTQKILEESTYTLQHRFEDIGYLEANENTEKFEKALIQIAMLVSASDGSMDQDEANIIKDWATKRLDYYREEFQDDEKVRLNSYIRGSYQQVSNNELDLHDILIRANDYTSMAQKLEIFEMSLDVARSDGVADEMELKVIRTISDVLHLDANRARAMIDKSLPISMHAGAVNTDILLGIDVTMSEKEVKKILREQYQKWNARVTSSDDEIRGQAEKMLELIAETRKKYS